MPQCYAVALPNGSRTNLEIGLANNVWGWKDSALDLRNSYEGKRRRAIASGIRSGDQLVVAIGTPGRTPSWDSAALQRVLVAEVRRGFYRSNTAVWPDELYPNRIDILQLTEFRDADADTIGLPAMRALRWSFHSQSTPCSIAGLAALPLVTAPTASELRQAELDLDAGDLLADDGSSLDANVVSKRRREQATLRRRLFGGRVVAECALCGRNLPVALLRAAHIKRRAAATDAERRHLGNVMSACLLGCDELFERGFLTLAADGTITTVDTDASELSSFMKPLQGRKANLDFVAAGPFAAWHRKQHGALT